MLGHKVGTAVSESSKTRGPDECTDGGGAREIRRKKEQELTAHSAHFQARLSLLCSILLQTKCEY